MKDGTRLKETFERRAFIAGGAGCLVWAALTARLAELQITRGQEYKASADENRISREPYPPKRGQIYDRFGESLATHRKTGRVSIVREQIDNPIATLDRLQSLLPMNDARRARVLRELTTEEPFIPVVVWDDLTYVEFARLSAHRAQLAGVNIELAQTRSYPNGRFFAHVLGYVARANDADLKRLTEDDVEDRAETNRLKRIFKHPDMRVGRSGVEAFADEWLRGQPGYKRFVKNASGRIIEELPDDDDAPQQGQDVWLTIDSGLQQAAVQRFGEESGSAVVMDIRNGDILALVSTPAFDPNDFVNGISTSEYNKLRSNERSPLYHKAYDGIYPPGSTFKMVVAAAALKAGVMTPSDRVSCWGKMRFGSRDFHCWKRQGHGSVDMHEAIKGSCDVYFYEMARRTGVEKIAEVTKEFGFGERFEIGLTGGAKGVVPNDAWKRAHRGEPWYEGETLNFGIGQGYLTATPLQLAVMTARIADQDGRRIVPRLIGSGPEIEKGANPEPVADVEILEKLRASMFGVTSEPGGTALRSGEIGYQDYRLAGKTGTAQVRRITTAERATGVLKNSQLPWRQRDHALFVAYAPAENPVYACSVIVEHGGGGSAVAAPIARDILKVAFERNSAGLPAYASGPFGQTPEAD